MEQCPICKRKFKVPEYLGALVVDAFVDGKYITMCPLCYAENVLRIHGIPWDPVGEIASEMFEEAKQQYPKWKQ